MSDYLKEVEFKAEDDQWPVDVGDAGKRDDNYITVGYDVVDGTYSLTYHPMAKEVTTHHFSKLLAALALRDAGYAVPYLTELLDVARSDARRTA